LLKGRYDRLSREETAMASEQAWVDDSELLERLRARDEKAFEAWVQRETPRLLAVARRMLRCEEDARDAVQDALIAAFRALPDFNGEASLSTWLHRIAVNCALMKLRSRRRRREEPIDALLELQASGCRVDALATQRPAEDWLDEDHRRVRVRSGIDSLPESYREVLVLRDLRGLDTAQAARELGLSSDALKMRLHRARQALRKQLAA
jgi:RNA polymerase sigma-70 factor (ECF subfamily)